MLEGVVLEGVVLEGWCWRGGVGGGGVGGVLCRYLMLREMVKAATRHPDYKVLAGAGSPH